MTSTPVYVVTFQRGFGGIPLGKSVHLDLESANAAAKELQQQCLAKREQALEERQDGRGLLQFTLPRAEASEIAVEQHKLMVGLSDTDIPSERRPVKYSNIGAAPLPPRERQNQREIEIPDRIGSSNSQQQNASTRKQMETPTRPDSRNSTPSDDLVTPRSESKQKVTKAHHPENKYHPKSTFTPRAVAALRARFTERALPVRNSPVEKSTAVSKSKPQKQPESPRIRRLERPSPFSVNKPSTKGKDKLMASAMKELELEGSGSSLGGTITPPETPASSQATIQNSRSTRMAPRYIEVDMDTGSPEPSELPLTPSASAPQSTPNTRRRISIIIPSTPSNDMPPPPTPTTRKRAAVSSTPTPTKRAKRMIGGDGMPIDTPCCAPSRSVLSRIRQSYFRGQTSGAISPLCIYVVEMARLSNNGKQPEALSPVLPLESFHTSYDSANHAFMWGLVHIVQTVDSSQFNDMKNLTTICTYEQDSGRELMGVRFYIEEEGESQYELRVGCRRIRTNGLLYAAGRGTDSLFGKEEGRDVNSIVFKDDCVHMVDDDRINSVLPWIGDPEDEEDESGSLDEKLFRSIMNIFTKATMDRAQTADIERYAIRID